MTKTSTAASSVVPVRRAATAFALAALLGALCLAAPASAATKECRHIQARKERNLCYEEQAKQKKAAPAARAPMDTQLERMNDARMQHRLRSICRGC